jgi:hypothetical protein
MRGHSGTAAGMRMCCCGDNAPFRIHFQHEMEMPWRSVRKPISTDFFSASGSRTPGFDGTIKESSYDFFSVSMSVWPVAWERAKKDRVQCGVGRGRKAGNGRSSMSSAHRRFGQTKALRTASKEEEFDALRCLGVSIVLVIQRVTLIVLFLQQMGNERGNESKFQ